MSESCDRCGHYSDSLETNLSGEDLCERCRDTIRGRSSSRRADQQSIGSFSTATDDDPERQTDGGVPPDVSPSPADHPNPSRTGTERTIEGNSDESSSYRNALDQRVSEGIDATNDLDYLLGLVDDALREQSAFGSDFERAAWVVAQWMQEVDFEPDISDFSATDRVPMGPVTKRDPGRERQQTSRTTVTDGGLAVAERADVIAQQRLDRHVREPSCDHVGAGELPCPSCFLGGGDP